jgi:sulfatase maturation enzyme AslB (radical SAM superfamily)
VEMVVVWLKPDNIRSNLEEVNVMKTLQDIYIEKFTRQTELAQYSNRYQLSLGGNCAHIGQLHITCKYCFSDKYRTISYEDDALPKVCNRSCFYCFDTRQQFDAHFEPIEEYELPFQWIADVKQNDRYGVFASLGQNNRVRSTDYDVIYNHYYSGEALLYIGVIEALQRFYIEDFEPNISRRRGFSKVYTNGTLLNDEMIDRLAKARIDQIRVNPAADGFSDEVYRNVENAAKVLDAVGIEVAMWPKNRGKLFEMLRIGEEIGVKFFTLCQTKMLDEKTVNAVRKNDPELELYITGAGPGVVMIDDGGLVEELMKEIIDKNYSFNALDCNCVKWNWSFNNHFNDIEFDDTELWYYPKAADLGNHPKTLDSLGGSCCGSG